MRSSVLGLVVGAAGVVVLASCGNSTYGTGGGGGGGGCMPTATKVCLTASLTFNPATLNIPAGTQVTWQNGSAITHTVTSSSSSTESFSSGNIGGAGSFVHTFSTQGTFPYYCMIHGADVGGVPSGMHGTITVTP